MRIGFDAKRYLNNATGLGNYSRELVHAYAKQFPDDKIFLISGNPEDANRKHDLPNIQFAAPKSKKRLFRVWSCYRLLNDLQLDVYHGLSNEIPFSAKRINAKLACTIHDVIFKHFPGYYNFWDRVIYNQKTKFALAKSQGVITTSNTTKTDLEKLYKNSSAPLTTIYQTINSRFLENPKARNVDLSIYKHFVYVSTFNKRKNHSILIEAFHKMHKQTNRNLILIGSIGEELENIKALIDSLNLNKRVFIYPNADADFIKETIASAIAFIYPSFYEGFGIPLIEAAALGTPIAASNISIFKEIGGDDITYFHPNKSIQMADIMLKMEDAEYNFEMSQKLKGIVAKSDPIASSQKLREVYLAV